MVNIKTLSMMMMLFFTFLNTAYSVNKPQLILKLDKTTSPLGRPIRAELYGVSLKSKVTNIDLSPLKNDFGIVIDFFTNNLVDERWKNQHIQVLKFKLYPRTAGKITVPSLIAEKIVSNPVILDITSTRTNTPKITLSKSTPYQREQFVVFFSLTSSNNSAQLYFEENPTVPLFETTPLLFKRIKQEKDKYLLTLGLAVTTYQSGEVTFTLPTVKYSENGVLRKTFYSKEQILHIKPLPTYMPATIPVGIIKLDSSITNTSIFTSNNISYLTLKVQGNLNSAYQLPPLLRQIKSNNKVDIFPAISKRSEQVLFDKVISTAKHTIPFRTHYNGYSSIASIKLQYFNPATHTIDAVIYKTQTVFALSLFWRSIVLLITIIILLYAIKYTHRSIRRHLDSKLHRQQALTILNSTKEKKSIRKAINLISKSENLDNNTDLSAWFNNWEKHYIKNEVFYSLKNKLHEFLYSDNSESDIDTIKQELVTLIIERKRYPLHVRIGLK
ncbi:MAG: hypothetical protein QM484_11010 [Woeseiaceae bacterium]